jgi:hypothetical protein
VGLVGTMKRMYVPSLKGKGSLLSESDAEDDPQQLLARAEVIVVEIEISGVLCYVWYVVWGILCVCVLLYLLQEFIYFLDKYKIGSAREKRTYVH